MTHYYFYFNLAHYPVAFVTKVGENQQDQARLRMMLNLAQHEQPQRIMFEPMSDNYALWKEYDPRVRQQERHVNFIDLWRFHFSPLHSNCWEWLLCRSI